MSRLIASLVDVPRCFLFDLLGNQNVKVTSVSARIYNQTWICVGENVIIYLVRVNSLVVSMLYVKQMLVYVDDLFKLYRVCNFYFKICYFNKLDTSHVYWVSYIYRWNYIHRYIVILLGVRRSRFGIVLGT